MKKVIFLFIALAITSFGIAQTSEGPKNGPIITLVETSHDFGDIVQGDSVKYVYQFKNTGTAPLIVSEVITTCGCTAPKWTRDPVMPGQTGEIGVTYRSAGKMGMQNKVVTVLSNAVNSPARFSLRVNVLPPKH